MRASEYQEYALEVEVFQGLSIGFLSFYGRMEFTTHCKYLKPGEVPVDLYPLIFYVPATVIFILVILLSVRELVKKRDSIAGIGELERCKRDLLFSFGSICILELFCHYILIFWENHTVQQVYGLSVSMLTTCLISRLLIYPTTKVCYLNNDFLYCTYIKILITFSILIYKSITHNTSVGYLISSFTILLFSAPFGTRTSDFYRVWNGDVALIRQEERREIRSNRILEEETRRKKKVKVEVLEYESESDEEPESSEKRFSFKVLECTICLKMYNGNKKRRIPRILRECGHTVCQGCVQNLAENGKQSYVICPFCRKRTDIHSKHKANQRLAINYTILQLIDEIESLENEEKLGKLESSE